MIEKDPGSPKIHQLRVIQLFETDFKFFLQTVFGQQITTFVAKYCNLNESQYESKAGKLCQSAILNKV